MTEISLLFEVALKSEYKITVSALQGHRYDYRDTTSLTDVGPARLLEE